MKNQHAVTLKRLLEHVDCCSIGHLPQVYPFDLRPKDCLTGLAMDRHGYGSFFSHVERESDRTLKYTRPTLTLHLLSRVRHTVNLEPVWIEQRDDSPLVSELDV